MLYRIFTEDVPANQGAVQNVLNKFLDGYTIVKGTGVWKGIPENSLIIETITEGEVNDMIFEIAEDLKVANKQDCILVQKIKNNHWFI